MLFTVDRPYLSKENHELAFKNSFIITLQYIMLQEIQTYVQNKLSRPLLMGLLCASAAWSTVTSVVSVFPLMFIIHVISHVNGYRVKYLSTDSYG